MLEQITALKKTEITQHGQATVWWIVKQDFSKEVIPEESRSEGWRGKELISHKDLREVHFRRKNSKTSEKGTRPVCSCSRNIDKAKLVAA
jgi:hypothetical protein